MRLTSILASTLLVSALATGCTVSSSTNGSSSLTVTNNSSFDIKELYLTFSVSSGFGVNHLGNNPLLPGEQIVLDGIACDTYDVLFVDETNAECETDGISLCFDNADWVITNNTCAVFKRSADPTPPELRLRTPSVKSQSSSDATK